MLKVPMKNILVKSMSTYDVRDMIFISTCKKSVIKIVICVSIVFIGVLMILIPFLLADNNQHHQRLTYPTDLKYILFWSQAKKSKRGHFFNRTPEFSSGQSMFISQNCPNINCFITYDKKTLARDEDFDAVVFDIDTIKKLDIDRLNFTRAPEQIYIFRSTVSSEKYSLCHRELDHFFNWTWTYKLNSDIPQPFYSIFSKNKTLVGPKKGMNWIEKMKHVNEDTFKMRQKNKAVVWIVNKCKLKTKHQDFIEELTNELKGYNYTIDLYGSCGTHKCSSIEKCNNIVENNYYFQLVLEEYISEDYVTENIVNAMSLLTIPIVIGAGDYRKGQQVHSRAGGMMVAALVGPVGVTRCCDDNPLLMGPSSLAPPLLICFLPPGAYVNAQAFDLKKLGAIIDYLIKNPEMYDVFFDWRNHYYYKESPKSQVCDLCSALNRVNRTTKSYRHFRYWWDPDYKDICQRMRLYKMFNNEK